MFVNVSISLLPEIHDPNQSPAPEIEMKSYVRGISIINMVYRTGLIATVLLLLLAIPELTALVADSKGKAEVI